MAARVEDDDPLVRLQLAYSLGELSAAASGKLLAALALDPRSDDYQKAAISSSIHSQNVKSMRAAIESATREQPQNTWLPELARLEKAFERGPTSNKPTVVQQMKVRNHSSPERRAIVAKYQPALSIVGEPERGRVLFKKHCAACHKLDSVGNAVGPDLTALTNRSPEALLVAMLDPNRAVEEKYQAYQVITASGKVHSGLIQAETTTSFTLLTQDGKSLPLLRNEIDELIASGRSLMPEGLEKQVSVHDVAHLIAYLRSQMNARRESQ